MLVQKRICKSRRNSESKHKHGYKIHCKVKNKMANRAITFLYNSFTTTSLTLLVIELMHMNVKDIFYRWTITTSNEYLK